MASKLSTTKGDAKDKGKASSSSSYIKTIFSLVSRRCSREFEEKHNYRLVVKQYVWKVSTVAQLSLSVVADLVAHQKIE